MADRYHEFQAFRQKLNERILSDDPGQHPDGQPRAAATLVTKRFFNLDTRAYEPGALDEPTKELLGLVASAVLRCDDCIAYHLDRCVSLDVSDAKIMEALDVALIVGGSIVIPHMRRAVEFLDAARAARA